MFFFGRKKCMKRFVVVIGLLLMMSNVAYADNSFKVNADGAILLDADTGQILHEQNADSALGLASMSKLMPIYILLDHIRADKIKWDDTYTVSKRVHELSVDINLGNVMLEEGRAYTIKELYESILIFSANASTVGIAEFIAGSEADFLPLMKKKADELGLAHYNFVNATGLNNSDLQGRHVPGTGPDDENVMSAKDVAKVGYSIIRDYPEILEVTKLPRKVFGAGTASSVEMTSWNYMLPGFLYEYDGVDGLKTGNTNFAGQCFISTVERDGQRFIAVVLNAKDKEGNSNYAGRFGTMKELFDYGFANFTKESIATEQSSVQINGDTVTVESEAVPILAEKGASYHAKVEPYTDVTTITTGTPVGHTVVEELNYLYEPPAVEAISTMKVSYASKAKDVSKGLGNYFSTFWQTIRDFVANLF